MNDEPAILGAALVGSAPVAAPGHVYLRVRDPKWANPHAYARVSVVVGGGVAAPTLGPWLHLFDREAQERIGEPTPQPACLPLLPGGARGFLDREWVVYHGPIDPADQP